MDERLGKRSVERVRYVINTWSLYRVVTWYNGRFYVAELSFKT